MADPSLSVLFLCTGNSARSQIAEVILRHLGQGKIRVESAGSAPQPDIHPMARLAARRVINVEMDGQRPKLLDQFGFDTVDAGPLKEGWRIQRDTPGYGPRRNAEELKKDLAAAKRYRDMK